MDELNIFKIYYTWYEGEYDETLVAKKVSKEQFEADLLTAKKFAESLIGSEVKRGNYLGKDTLSSASPNTISKSSGFSRRKWAMRLAMSIKMSSMMLMTMAS